MAGRGLAPPPEGALSGDTVPRENEQPEWFETTVQNLVGEMKAHPGYRGRSDNELRELAAERIKQLED